MRRSWAQPIAGETPVSAYQLRGERPSPWVVQECPGWLRNREECVAPCVQALRDVRRNGHGPEALLASDHGGGLVPWSLCW